MKKTKTSVKQVEIKKREYGLISMIAMVVGIVIGSGIFIKNQSLIEISNNIFIAITAWVIGSLIVLAIVVAFIELFTRVEDEDEQVTSSNIGRIVIGEKFGKVIGFYFAYVNIPSTMSAFAIFGAGEIMTLLPQTMYVWQSYLTRVSIIFAIILIFFAINGVFTTPGRIFQNIGTTIKVFPLVFTTLLLAVLLVSADDFNSLSETQNILDNNYEQIHGEAQKSGFLNWILLLGASMPSIMFVYDGFIISGSLSKEGKGPHTFRTAVTLGIVFTIIIYFLFSISIFVLGDADPNSANPYAYGSIQNVMYNVFDPQVAKVITPIVTVTIIISMLTATSGCIIGSISSISDLSANNLIQDKEGKLLAHNKYYALPNASIYTLCMAVLYLLMMLVLDTMAMPIDAWGKTVEQANEMQNFAGFDYGTSYFSSLASLGAFVIFTFILLAALILRGKNPPSKKYWFFVPTAIFAIVSMSVVLIIYSIELFSNWENVQQTIVNALSLILNIVITAFFYFWSDHKMKQMTEEDYKTKEKYIDVYKHH